MLPTLDGISVLAVDDDPDSLEILACVFELAGAKVRAAKSAREAIDLLDGWTPDILLLDIAMPKMDGFELLAAVRSRPGLAEVPAVAVTAQAYQSDRDRARDAGFTDFVAKPLDVEVVLSLVAKLVDAT